MKFRSIDPLLTAAKVVVALLIALCIFAAVMLVIALGAIFTASRAEVLADLAQAGAPAYAYWVVALGIAMLVGLFVLAYRFLMDLWALIGSVDSGDAFRAKNAELLARMGWTALGGYITAFLLGILAAWVQSFEKLGKLHTDVDVDLGVGGLLLILTLFILARVFKQGAAMREDLEGTV